MSLTSHLKSTTSPIGQFIRQRFAHTARLTKVANAQLREKSTIHPILADMPYPYGTVGMAIDYRIRYAFAITPYRQLAAWKGAMCLNPKIREVNDDIPENQIEHAARPNQHIESTQKSSFLKRFRAFLKGGSKLQQKEEGQWPYSAQLLLAFFDNLDRIMDAIQPAGRCIDEEEAELTLARYCYLLALFEEAYRSSGYLFGPLMDPEPKRTLEELLAIPKDDWLDDICFMFARFYNNYAYLLAHPHLLNPEFQGSKDVGNADADLIVDGCLIDIKASIAPKIEPKYLRQLAGYLLLDYNDALHIESVGIYMARQGMLLTWDVLEFLRQLTGDEGVLLASLRQEFRTVCQDYNNQSMQRREQFRKHLK